MKALSFFFKLSIVLGLALFISSCKKDDPVDTITDSPYNLNLPSHFPQANIPNDNKITVYKVELGRKLFYDKNISSDNLVSCGSCHLQSKAFSSAKRQDIQAGHGMTKRHTSTLFNLIFTQNFFWDGRTNTLEATCKDALKNEQLFDISFIKDKIINTHNYKELFQTAYGTTEVTEDMVAGAIATFIRTMISAGSKVDKGLSEGNVNRYLNPIELEGKSIFESEEGDCFHCHGDAVGNPMMTDNLFHNNALDAFTFGSPPLDLGRMEPTSNQNDMALFKTPPLRNISYSAPYMHDGRFQTFDEVLNHYNSGLKNSPTVDPNMKKVSQGGLQLLPDKVAKLKAYILAFDDPDFINDTRFSDPF